MIRALLVVSVACSSRAPTSPTNRGSDEAEPPRAHPCGLDVDLPKLDDLAWEATRRNETTIGSCRISLAPHYERFQLHDGQQLVAELIYTCGMVAYAAGLHYGDARIGATGESVVARWPSRAVRCSATIALPESLAGQTSSCEVGPEVDLPTQYLVRAPPPDDQIDGAPARALLASHDLVGIVLYASARCR